jgi:hypothetical protein
MESASEPTQHDHEAALFRLSRITKPADILAERPTKFI